MAEVVQLEDVLTKLAHARTEAGDDDRKRSVKAAVFGDSMPPRRIGRFIDLGLLGSGAMGTVRRAYDERLAREVAIKLVRHGSAPQHHDRLLREAQALAQLSHPNVVQIYEVGEIAGEVFIAMELVEGVTLHEWQREPRAWRECLGVYLQAGRGLAAAHTTGLVHRDFKPANCIRDEHGRVRVLDFGLARAVGFVEPPGSRSPASDELIGSECLTVGGSTASCGTNGSLLQAQLTEQNAIVGTIAYMAPEQLGGRRADSKSDQFSFCVALYEALHGLLPFSRDPRAALSAMMRGNDQPPRVDPSSPRVPRALRRAVVRGLSADPEARWPSMEALLEELGRLERRRPLTWATAGVGSALLATGGWLAAPDQARVSACHDAAGGSAELWSDERRSDVEPVLLAFELDYAQQTWSTVDESLGRYTQGLALGYVDACEATKVRSEESLPDLELRNTCLDRHRVELEQTISMLAQADEAVVLKAVDLVTALPSHAECTDVEALRRAAEPEEVDEETLALVRERLGIARRQRTVGKYDEGLATIEALLGMLPELDGSLLAEVQVVEGTLRSELGQHDRAEDLLRRAYEAAVRQRAESVELDALIPLVYVLGVDRAKPDAALELGNTAEALAHRKGVSEQLLVEVLTAQGHVLNARGEPEPAQRRYEAALELLEATLGMGSITLAEPLDGLAVALRAQGELESALGASQRSLRIRSEALGERHPDVAHQHVNLGAVLYDMKDFDGAREQYQSALEILLRVEPLPRERLAHARTNLGAALAKLERYEEAESELVSAIEDWEAILDPGHPHVAKARASLGHFFRRLRRFPEAIEQFERALVVFEERGLETFAADTRSALQKVREAMAEDRASLGDGRSP